jgi:AraC family transcriptional regulator
VFRERGARCLNIEIESGWHDHARHFSPVLDDSAEFQHGPPHELALKIYREFQQRDAISPLAIGGLALELLAEMARASVRDSTSSRWLKQAKEILHERFSESLCISDIATAVGVHPAHLSRTFRRTFGCTIGEYQRRLRVEYACRQLAGSNVPLVEIAHAAGFYDQGHFSRTFKRLKHLSPARYRAAYRTR